MGLLPGRRPPQQHLDGHAGRSPSTARPGQNTLVHEIGHSLGLNHPGPYNNGADNDGDGVADPISYEGTATHAQDSEQFSVMTYFSTFETGGNRDVRHRARVPDRPADADAARYPGDPVDLRRRSDHALRRHRLFRQLDRRRRRVRSRRRTRTPTSASTTRAATTPSISRSPTPACSSTCARARSSSAYARHPRRCDEVNVALAELGPLQMDQAFYDGWIDFTHLVRPEPASSRPTPALPGSPPP